MNLKPYEDSYRDEIIAVWESSVRATHHFLSEGDIEFYKSLVKDINFNEFEVYCAFFGRKSAYWIYGGCPTKTRNAFSSPRIYW